MREIVQQIVAKTVQQYQVRSEKMQMKLNQLHMDLKRLEQCIVLLEQPVQVFGTDVIERVWNSHPQAPDVFARYHLNACHQCAVRFDETVQEAARAYGFSEEAMLVEINMLLRGEQ